MPLNTQIVRKGKLLPVRWGQFHVAAMTLAAAWDSGEGGVADTIPSPESDPDLYDGLDYPTEPFVIGQRDVFDLVMYHVIAQTPLNDGEYTLRKTHSFKDATDGEVFTLKPGDVLKAWRS